MTDGFINRHRRLIELLSRLYDVTLLSLQVDGEQVDLSPRWMQDVVVGPHVPSRFNTRAERIRRALYHSLGADGGMTDRLSVEVALAVDPDVVLTLGPWLDVQVSNLWRRFPSVHLLEEDIWRTPELTSPTLAGRAMRRVEHLSHRRLPQPQSVVVITETEVPHGRRRFPHSTIIVLPYTMSGEEWPPARTVSLGDEILVLGVLTQSRNSEGLSEILAEVDRRPSQRLRFRLVSDEGLHADIQPYLSRPWVRYDPSRSPVHQEYRTARMALLPAVRVTGVKTTLLQAWSQQTPVVAFEASTSALPRSAADAVASATSATEIVDRLESLWTDAAERARLAHRGLEEYQEHFSEEAATATLLEILRQDRSIKRTKT